jgi:hypothetical protein
VPVLGYVPMFLGMSCFYFIGFLLLRWLMGDFKMIEEPRKA